MIKTFFKNLTIFFSIYLITFAPVLAEINNNTLPTNPNIASGSATINQTSNSLTINQTTNKLITNWSSFNIGKDASVEFIQPSSSSTALNRVNSNDPSYIYGSLKANGKLILINPSGVLFQGGSKVDVGAIIASSLNLQDGDFLNEQYIFEKDGLAGTVNNSGTINAFKGGAVALLSDQVTNDGEINTPEGTTALLSGEKITLTLNGNKLIKYTIDTGTLNSLVENKQAINAGDGIIILSAKGLSDVSQSVVKNTGTLKAESISKQGGKIYLSAREGEVINSGTISVNSTEDKGGNIEITGDEITIETNSTLTATGKTGGGQILVGGSWQNSDTNVYQATIATVETDTLIDASATDNGDGGEVVIWSDIYDSNSITKAQGTIYAKAGPNGGDGGRIETSGYKLITDGVSGSASSNLGVAGLWLFDPTNIEIGSSGSSADGTDDGSDLTASSINSLLNSGTSVTVTTQSSSSELGDLTVSSEINKSSGVSDVTLTLRAANLIRINDEIKHTGGTGVLNIILDSDNNTSASTAGSSPSRDGGGIIIMEDNISSGGGDITFGGTTSGGFTGGDLYIGGSSTALSIDSGGGDIDIKGQVLISNTNASGVTISSSNGSVTIGGSIDSANTYRFVDDSEITATSSATEWINASADAVLKGGYLVSITSRIENQLAAAATISGGSYRGAWIGAWRDKDNTKGGGATYWYYDDNSPEANTAFLNQGTGPINSAYNNFGSGEPNGTGTDGEWAGQFFGDQANWNDLVGTRDYSQDMASVYNVMGYVMETNVNPTKLTINAGTGDVTLSGAVGSNKALSDLSITGAEITGSSVALNNSTDLNITNSGTSSLTGVISGTSVDLIKNGSGKLSLSGNNTYSGTTTLNTGSIVAAHNNALGSGSLSLGGSTTLFLENGISMSNDISLAGNATIQFNPLDVEYLVVAGGGGGGNAYDNGGGAGGGAGMVLSGTASLTPGTSYDVTVGAGGSGGADIRSNRNGSSGSNSVFNDVTALGGGAGGGSRTGGDPGLAQVGNASAPTGGDGNGGGNSGDGGGGASGSGTAGSGGTAGTGGAGVASSITGSSVTYGVGGNGGTNSGPTNGANGTANRGNGGAGGSSPSSNSASGGNGGSGIVVVRYTGSDVASGGTESTSGSDRINTFTTTGDSNFTISSYSATLSGDISGSNDLTVNSSGGTITLSGTNSYSGDTTISGGTTKLTGSLSNSTDLIISSGATLDLQATQAVASLDLDGTISKSAGSSSLTVSGAADIGGNITTSGAQIYTGAVTLSANNTLTTTNSQITFSDTINSDGTARNLATSVGTSETQFDGIVGGSSGLGTITITGALDLNAAINSASSLSVSTTSNLGANVTTSGTQTYTGEVDLSSDITITTTNSNVTFSDKVVLSAAAQSLTINAGTGNVSFGNSVGGAAVETEAGTIGTQTVLTSSNWKNTVDTTGIFSHSVDLAGSNDLTIGDITFVASDGDTDNNGFADSSPHTVGDVKIYAKREINGGGWDVADLGSDSDSNNLETLFSSIKWNQDNDDVGGGYTDDLAIELSSLTAGKIYKLQMFFGEDSNSNRGFDIDFVNGTNDRTEIEADYDTNPNSNSTGTPQIASFIDYTFKSQGTSAKLILEGDGWSGDGGAFTDRNPIISGVSLETISDSSSYSLSNLNVTAGTVSTSGNIYSNGAVTLNNSSDSTINNLIRDGSGGSASLVKGGSAVLTLGGDNDYTGSTTINAGTLKVASDDKLGSAPSSVDVDNIIFNGGTLNISATDTFNSNRGITMTGAGTINTNAGTTLTYGGLITGSGALTKSGTGTLTLSGASDYSGGTVVSAGTLKAGAASSGTIGSATSGPFGTGTIQNSATLNVDSNLIHNTKSPAGTITNKPSPTVAYGSAAVTEPYGDSVVNALTNSGNGTLSYASDDTDVATVDGSGNVTIVGVGSATITATAATSNEYATANDTYTLTVTKASPTISGLSNQSKTTTDSNFTLAGTPSISGLSISYSSNDTDVATVNSSTGAVTIIGEGTATITASISGTANYNAASSTYTLTVTEGTSSSSNTQKASDNAVRNATNSIPKNNTKNTPTVNPTAGGGGIPGTQPLINFGGGFSGGGGANIGGGANTTAGTGQGAGGPGDGTGPGQGAGQGLGPQGGGSSGGGIINLGGGSSGGGGANTGGSANTTAGTGQGAGGPGDGTGPGQGAGQGLGPQGNNNQQANNNQGGNNNSNVGSGGSGSGGGANTGGGANQVVGTGQGAGGPGDGTGPGQGAGQGLGPQGGGNTQQANNTGGISGGSGSGGGANQIAGTGQGAGGPGDGTGPGQGAGQGLGPQGGGNNNQQANNNQGGGNNNNNSGGGSGSGGGIAGFFKNLFGGGSGGGSGGTQQANNPQGGSPSTPGNNNNNQQANNPQGGGNNNNNSGEGSGSGGGIAGFFKNLFSGGNTQQANNPQGGGGNNNTPTGPGNNNGNQQASLPQGNNPQQGPGNNKGGGNNSTNLTSSNVQITSFTVNTDGSISVRKSNLNANVNVNAEGIVPSAQVVVLRPNQTPKVETGYEVQIANNEAKIRPLQNIDQDFVTPGDIVGSTQFQVEVTPGQAFNYTIEVRDGGVVIKPSDPQSIQFTEANRTLVIGSGILEAVNALNISADQMKTIFLDYQS